MAGRKLDEYKALEFYAENTKAKQAGFSKFQVEDAFFFCRYVDGDIAMISQSYTSKAGRDNGIESVKKNEKTASRYRFEERDSGTFGFSLRAGNGQEVAVSPNFKTAAGPEKIATRLAGSLKSKKTAPKTATAKLTTKSKPVSKPKSAAKPTAANTTAFTSKDGRNENYKHLAFYKKHGGTKDGFNSFEQGGAFYFNYSEDDKPVLISESYTAKRGRDNGIESTTKNMKLESAYQFHVHETGKHYFDINAKNGQEVATSRWYANKAAALAAAASLRGETPKPKRSANVEQNYQPLAFYKKHSEGQKDGFERFKGEDGEYYFTYFENDKIALISEGYPAAAVRDKGLASVEKNMKTPERYVYGKTADGKDGFALRAGNHKEIARSVSYGSAAAAAAGAAYLLGTRKRSVAKPAAKVASVAAAAAKKPVVKAESKPPVVKTTPPKPVKSKPKKAGAIVAAAAIAPAAAAAAAAKKTVVKAESKPPVVKATPPKPVESKPKKAGAIVAAAAIAPAAAAVAAVAALPPKVEPVAAAPITAAVPTPSAAPAIASPEGGGIWGWLKWLLLALLALLALIFLFKACASGPDGKTTAATPVKTDASASAALVACWDGSKARSESACPAKVTCWDNSFAKTTASCPVQPPARTFKCWDGSMSIDKANCPVEVEVVAKAPAATVRTPSTQSVNVASAISRNTSASSIEGRICGPSPNVLYDVSNSTPTPVGRLGTNPQFGNSLSMSPTEFFQNLQFKYQTNSNDRSFLNLMARSLGYDDFMQMDASMISNDTLTNGTSGLLGYGASHALQFSTLKVSDPTHLEAFKVRSANGSDVHFMKRCGNYMYVCQPR